MIRKSIFKSVFKGIVDDFAKWVLKSFDNPYCLLLSAAMFFICAGLNFIVSVAVILRAIYTIIMVLGFALHIAVNWARIRIAANT